MGFVQFPQRFDGIDKSDRYANRNTVFFDIKCVLVQLLTHPCPQACSHSPWKVRMHVCLQWPGLHHILGSAFVLQHEGPGRSTGPSLCGYGLLFPAQSPLRIPPATLICDEEDPLLLSLKLVQLLLLLPIPEELKPFSRRRGW